MKKNFKYALLGAIALTGAVGFSACQSSDEVVETNPNYNPETGEVYTQFVFNVATGNTPKTRMSEDATQAATTLSAEKFRGIQNAHILCLRQTDDGKPLTSVTAPTAGDNPTSGTTADKDFDMAMVAAAGTLSSSASRRVLEMSLPININTMLFYGRATVETDYNAYGHLDDTHGYEVSTNLSAINFQLCRRLTSADKTAFQNTQSLLAAILTCIMNVNRGTVAVGANDTPGTKNDQGEPSIPVYGFDLEATYMPNMSWSDYLNPSYPGKTPTDNNTDMTELEVKLANAYKQMTTIQNAELRNGSGPAIVSTIKDLWSVVNAVRCATPTSKAEALAKYMAKLISDEISKYFTYVTLPLDGKSVSGVGINNSDGDNGLIASLTSDNYWPSTAGTKPATFTGVKSSLSTFPSDYDLPQGSTHLLFDSSKRSFSYAVNYNSSAAGNGQFTVDDYYYPAELLYFGNSPIRVSNTEHAVTDYPANTTTWNTEWDSSDDTQTAANTPWYGWEANSHVQSTTRSVAMKNDINYGTALLKSTVGYSSDIVNDSKKLKDNNSYIQDRDNHVTEDDHEIDVTDTSFKLVGILVGGQSPKVGWNYLPNLSSEDRQGYIYDKAITNSGVINKTSGSSPNYTLVFDNYSINSSQDKVYVALELQNNTGKDFFGKDNLIPAGGNFYLIGELDPTSESITTITSWPTYHALPPYIYDTGGTQTRVTRVFIQDYMTTANFKIGEWSLQYAYLTVPDLRSSSVTLGLSVDVQWSTGLIFDNVVVGGNVHTPEP